MFKNVGGKIKIIAIIIFILGVVSSMGGSIVGAIIATTFIDDFVLLILLFLFCSLCGILMTWIFSIFIYGFGQLIENSDKLVENTNEAPQNQIKKSPQIKDGEDFYTFNKT